MIDILKSCIVLFFFFFPQYLTYIELINYTQPVYVWREDPNSRQNTIKEIIERTTSKEDWPQVGRTVWSYVTTTSGIYRYVKRSKESLFNKKLP